MEKYIDIEDKKLGVDFELTADLNKAAPMKNRG